MAKIKFTKTELKLQQDALKQFSRFLPTLQLKKQQLQNEVRRSVTLLEKNRQDEHEMRATLHGIGELFGDETGKAAITALVKIARVRTGVENIAGIAVPTFDAVEFEPLSWSLYDTDWFVDDAVAALKNAVALREARKILEEQHRLLAAELRTTTQRVNLFEKVKIPECRENIRRINIAMGDANTAAVARCKIAKRKAQAVATSQ